jgi:hypothetical protein
MTLMGGERLILIPALLLQPRLLYYGGDVEDNWVLEEDEDDD